MSQDDAPYLIWSNEHAAWWGQGQHGYVPRLSDAGRYSHEEALRICAEAIPGDAARSGVLPELPVREADAFEMWGRYRDRFPDLPDEPWE